MALREQDAYEAYLKLLAQKGIAKEDLLERKFVLLRLMLYIENIPTDGQFYRKAVDKVLKRMSNEELSKAIPVIRDYYSFWIKDIKAIAAMNQDHEFDADGHQWHPDTSDLKSLWKSLDKLTLTETEAQPLETYEYLLRSRGADDEFVSTRKKLAKLLLLRLRDVPHKQPNAYRKVIDANLAIFNAKEMHHTFLNVAREFYGFWRGNQDIRFAHTNALAFAA
jgi:hypothetical protein